MLSISNDEFLLLKDYLYKICGIEVPEEKSYLFRTRLCDIIEQERLSSFYELYHLLKLKKDDRLEKRIIEVMTTHETSFFRDMHPFDTFKTELLPMVIKQIKSGATLFQPRLCILSAGCSTGQEPYSIAMIIKEVIDKNPELSIEKIIIMATDISPETLKKAKYGEYNKKDIERGLPDYYRKKYFHNIGNRWIINDSIRSMVTFDEVNLSKNLPGTIGRFDFIFCRNVIIYFSLGLKKRLIDSFRRLLNSWGILIIGASENLYKVTDNFLASYSGQTIYYRVKK